MPGRENQVAARRVAKTTAAKLLNIRT